MPVEQSKLLPFEVRIPAGSQFLGNEFKVTPPRRGTVLRLKEIDLQLGSGSKSYRITKHAPDGAQLALIQQSIDPTTGAPAVTSAESVVITGPEFETLLTPGQQIPVTTGSATDDMIATLYYEETRFGVAS